MANVIEKAREVAGDLYKKGEVRAKRTKNYARKTWNNFKDYVLTQNQKADKKAEGRERPNLTGGLVVTKRAKNGGHI